MQIILASMPWSIFNRPSIQLGSLKSYLTHHLPSVSTKCIYPYLEISKSIGFETYNTISKNNWAGEALYGSLLFTDQIDNARDIFIKCLADKTFGNQNIFYNTRKILKKQLTDLIKSIELANCDLIGFSICFSQLLPSLYAASLIKKHFPHIKIVFGGSTCTPEIASSLLQVFPTVDYIITGEGEKPLLELCKHLLLSRPLQNANILTRQKKHSHSTNIDDKSQLHDINLLPTPDYDEYFQALTNNELTFIPIMPLEFSRGCWWNKCSFCNLNLQWLGYRYKNSQRMLQEFKYLKNRYHCLDFTFTDNALPVKEAGTFFKILAKEDEDPTFFAEIRHLKTQQNYSSYKSGGLDTIQVGIESLSDSLLKKMNKGTNTIENIAAMKYAMSAGMQLEGNLILEFPGSTKSEITETLHVLDFLLPFKPLKAATFFLGHGSPVSCNPQNFNIQHTYTHIYYKKIYPENLISQLTLLFQSYRGDRSIQKKMWLSIRKKINTWHSFHQKRNRDFPALSYKLANNFLIIRQEKPDGTTLHHRLKGISRDIYLACDEIVSKKELLSTFNSVKQYQLSKFIAELSHKRLLFANDDSVIALAIRQNRPLR